MRSHTADAQDSCLREQGFFEQEKEYNVHKSTSSALEVG